MIYYAEYRLSIDCIVYLVQIARYLLLWLNYQRYIPGRCCVTYGLPVACSPLKRGARVQIRMDSFYFIFMAFNKETLKTVSEHALGLEF